MQDLYATSFEIADDDLDRAYESVAALIAEWAWRAPGRPPAVLGGIGEAEEVNGYVMAWAEYSPGQVERALEVTLRHPDPEVQGRTWQSVVDLARRDDGLRLTLRISREAVELRLVPASLSNLRRPGLIPEILNGRSCSVGGLDLTASADRIHVTGADDFVHGTLASGSRALPVLVLATFGGSARLVDPDYLADQVAGLAHVAHLGGQLAWLRFKEAVGDHVRVPHGGARIYWPGFGQPADDLQHRFWTRSALEDARAPLDRLFFALLTRISVHAVPRDPLVRQLRDRSMEQRLDEIRSSREEVDEVFDELLSENRGLLARVSELEAELTGARNDLAVARGEQQALKGELRVHRANYAAIAAAVGEEASEEVAEVEDEADASSAPTTWNEFYEYLDVLTGPFFAITQRAREGCNPSPYPDPARMWRHLEALAESAEAWARSGCSVGMDLKTWLHQNYGIEISLHDGGLARRAEFEFGGKTYSREPHVKVDDYVDPARCGRIYFAVVPDEQRFIVDHIGLHL